MPEDLYRRVDACRLCGGKNLSTVLDLGTPFISDFLLPGEQGDRAPLLMARCEDCTLVQTRHTVARDRLFREYWYRSSTNESMVAALRDVVDDASSHVVLHEDEHEDSVLDIGCNDSTMLRMFPKGCYRMGIDPVRLRPANEPSETDFLQGYFPEVNLGSIFDSAPKVITSIAQFYNVDEPHQYVAAIKELLHPEGVWVVQLQDLASVLRDRAFDYFCHEHLCLYSLHSFERLIHDHGLELQDWSTNAVNGGSMRLIVGHGNTLKTSRRSEDEPQAWTDFANAIEGLKVDTVSLLARLRLMGKTVIGYGASTKGNTLLQFYGITPELLPAIAERQEQKWGRRTVGSGIPIISEAEARAMNPDYFFVGPWHFAESFERRESVPLILPLPQLEVRSRARVAA